VDSAQQQGKGHPIRCPPFTDRKGIIYQDAGGEKVRERGRKGADRDRGVNVL